MALFSHMPLWGGATPAVVTYVSSNSDTTNTSTYTFTGQSIGTASSDRMVAVGAIGNSGGTISISGVTIDGNAMSEVVQLASANNMPCGIYSRLVTSGTTADIVVTFSGGAGLCGIVVWSLTRLQSTTAVSTGRTSGSDPASASVNVSAGGVVVAISGSRSATSTSWTNATESSDFIVESLVNVSSADAQYLVAQTGLSVSADFAGANSQQAMTVATFR